MYKQLSECHLKLDSKHEAASALVDAANAYKKTSKADSAACLHKAAEYFTDLGRLSIAAKHFKDMGDIYEEQGEVKDAIAMFSKAADLYSGEEVTSTSNNCKLKVAQLSATAEDYGTAVELFTEVALSSLDSNLLKYSVKGYLLCAGLCVLCSGDAVAIANAVDKYLDLDATFEDTREHKLLAELAECMEAGDVDRFTSVVQEFDSMSRLDSWKTTLLLRAKKRCASMEAAGEDDLT